MNLPPTMRAWQWTTCRTTLSSALTLTTTAPVPSRPLAPGESLIRVHAAALNQIDYKLAELPLVGRLAIPKPATPGLDFAGVVARTGPDSPHQLGQRVFGKLEPKQQVGTLGEYVIGSREGTVALPEGVSFEAGAALGVCGLVTYQALVRNVRDGERVVVNGGSGGTGTFAVQIAKALGCEVVATCSGANVQLCKDLGADEVIDYRTQSVTDVLEKSGRKVDFVLDNVGEPAALYWQAPRFTKSGAKYVQIGSQVSLGFIYDLAFRFVVPTWLGGGQRPFSFAMASTNLNDYEGLAGLVAEGKVKPVIDEVIEMEDVPQGYKKLKTGRARGKIVVRVAKD
ncbi:oxidoreductase domain-containing protein [Karstenula rhodostoma CBS 690.94]|uniref:Oxidoreductase domain-containing protein n=1 Tax=Karstenula rhodostoma CBS 690.94 TaxID=1392251 RepID=A0A9P4U7W3_9PLEO|nr:oxidoreductase domain-containing protein [Karstenula rhodostoma CBS 690.94]